MYISIFIPETLKVMEPCFLAGKYLTGGYVSNQEQTMIIIDDKIEDELSPDSVGEISSRSVTKTPTQSPWIVVETSPFFFISNLTVDGKLIDSGKTILVFYESTQIKDSYLLKSNATTDLSNDFNYFIQRVKMENSSSDKILKSDLKPKWTKPLIYSYLLITNFMSLCSKNVNEFLMKKFDVKSYFLHQLAHRFKQIKKFCNCFSDKEDLVAKRIAGLLLCDILLGVLSSYLIYNWTSASELHYWFQSSTKIVADNVQDLLSWLKGAPAGLKLNQPLTESLAEFFSYHVYLWTLYLDEASPALAVIAHLFVGVGLLGISSQIALLTDFLNLAVLHVHCFYIYAARLHMVQMSLLGSQWRGFRGRKWNPLKERVDARSERRQRPLIKTISAVGFTLVVFLLPTTVVYYAVFLILRLCLMSAQGFSSLLLWALNSNPVSIAWLHAAGSPILKGKFHLEMYLKYYETASVAEADSSLRLRLHLCLSPLQEAVDASHSADVFPSMPRPSLGRIWSSLIYAKDLL